MTKQVVVLACVMLWLGCEFCHSRMWEEITNKEHLFDLILSEDGHGQGDRYGFLVMYNDEDAKCDTRMRALDLDREGDALMDNRFILLARYNPIACKRRTWYEWSDDYNLERFLNVTEVDLKVDCPKYFFIDKDNPQQPTAIADLSGQGVSDWVWNRLRVSVRFTNHHNAAVKVYWNPKSSQQFNLATELAPSESRIINTFVSHKFYAEEGDTGVFLTAWDIRGTEHIAIEPLTDRISREEYLFKKLPALDQEDLKTRDSMTWSHSRRHIYNYKIPPLIPRFTEAGFEKRPMPQEMCQLLTTFYKQSADAERVVETWNKGATEVNFYPIQTSMVHIPWDIKKKVADAMQPILEDWCQCDLAFETFYGIREYYNSSRLMNHVDRIKTHVVSAILQVAQDIEEDWELEVIDLHGKKRFVKQYPCELVLYESSKIIHGRPKPINGRLYASGFIHFKPKDHKSWPYETTQDNYIITTSKRVAIRPEYDMGVPFEGTNPWRRKDAKPFKDEL